MTLKRAFQDFLYNEKIIKYDPALFPAWLETHLEGVRTVKDNKRITTFNCPAAFDIETSSFYERGEKRACMYLWAFGINGGCLYGRTWEEFETLCSQLTEILSLSDTKLLRVYVHNLAYEFQFIRRRFDWEKVFSLKERKPVQAITAGGIEFRCSYLLSGYSLEKLGDELQRYKVKKAVGALDYDLVRHSSTPLTDSELHYQANDVRVVMAYIKECIENEGNNITYIPLTKTGYVRRYCRNACLYDGPHHRQNRSYKLLMNALQLQPDVYRILKRTFSGGFTHANGFYQGRVLTGVGSYDFTSSYPAMMVAKLYPMSSAEEVEITSIEELERNLALYCCLFDVEITGLKPRLFWDHPLSRSKCYNVTGYQDDNGRLVRADHLYTTITEQDFFTLQDFYTWDSLRVGKFYRFQRGYLPKVFVKSILKLYEDKTRLKGVEGKEAEYLLSKGMLNACYGMAVTDIVRPDILYDPENGWLQQAPDLADAIAKYNKGRRRFLYYPWGVWVTAHARRALFSGIKAFGPDYIYADTDSIKALNIKAHEDYIKSYNESIIRQLETACDYHGIDRTAIRPKNIKGNEKQLGVWDFEGFYTKFKTLGAKRYMTVKDGELSITVSGVNKVIAVPWLDKTFCKSYADVPAFGNTKFTGAFRAFDDNLYIPAEYTGKNTHTYIDEETRGVVTDYLGTPGEYHELSCVHLEGAEYSLSISKAYAEYLKGVRLEYD